MLYRTPPKSTRTHRPISSHLVSALFLLLFSFVPFAQCVDQKYCSPFNTGSDFDSVSDTFQSNGLCIDLCKSKYAFAVLSGSTCWCSNYAPADTVSVSKCDQNCPGYPEDHCGADDLFGYIALDLPASGTRGSSSSPPTTTLDKKTSTYSSKAQNLSLTISVTNPDHVTMIKTVKESTTTILTSEKASLTTSTLLTTIADSLKSETTGNPSVVTMEKSLQVVTVSGAVVTHIITTTSPSQSSVSEQESEQELSIGAIVGAAIGGVVGLILIVGFLLFFFCRRCRSAHNLDPEEHRSALRRTVSTISNTRLLRGGEDAAAAKSGLTQSPQVDVSDSTTLASDRRNSRPLYYDQRLNPSALMHQKNGSHASVITMQDNCDYHRTLNVRNPDLPDGGNGVT